MIVIRAKCKNGFWRCGVFHPDTPTQHNDHAFTKEQLAILQDEPMLSVTVEKTKSKTDKGEA